ncbi:MAG: diflavin oxidoreductase, partial [Planctomycetota bacterium]
MQVPYIPQDAPFNGDQRQWLAGFFAGLHSRMLVQSETVATAQAGAVVEQRPLLILYGTQTGNAENVANEIAQVAKANGLLPQVVDMDESSVEQMAAAERLLIVCSTYGEGEQPDNAQLLWEAISADSAPSMSGVHYSVLALGDTNYDLFCEAGKMWDGRLAELGAARIWDRLDCDVDFEAAAREWIDSVVPLIATKGGTTTAGGSAVSVATKKPKPQWTRTNPYPATLKTKRVLSGEGSGKEIVHYEIDLGTSNLEYEPGDALNVFPTNEPTYVQAILDRLQCSGDEVETFGSDERLPLRQILTDKLEIRTVTRDLLATVAERSGDLDLNRLLEADDSKVIDDYLWGKDVLDLLSKFGAIPLSAAEFIRLCKPIQARAYSISSSPRVHENEVHLTVASVRYDGDDGREHKGVCSTYLADLLDVDGTVPVYFSVSKHFRVPADHATPAIMVGPGTGIAPFRAFLEEREATGAAGANWLFFGDRTAASDFIYRDELEGMQERGVLTRLDLAWSRDQADKVYVQDKMRSNGAELWAWLEKGAYFYVCGDAYRMAKDVDQALHDIVAEHGGKSVSDAVAYVN